jgi:hypothetical protein
MRVTASHAWRVFWDLLRIPWLHRHDAAVGRRLPVGGESAVP